MSETKQAETRATAVQVNFFREMAMEYLRDWSDNYMRHAELAIIDWDGATAEFHLANFAARARQQTAKEIAQKLRKRADEYDAKLTGRLSQIEIVKFFAKAFVLREEAEALLSTLEGKI